MSASRPFAFLAARRHELFVFAVALLLYLPALGFGFVFDDAALIGSDGQPLPLGGSIPYRPLRYASYLVDASLGGSAFVYHAHNLLLHGLVAALVVSLARRLGGRALPALLAGLLVAVHPLSVEAAAYVAGRRDLLCVAFGLLSLLAALSGRWPSALLLLLLSVASKESGLVFAAPLLAAAFGPGARQGRDAAAAAVLAGSLAGLAFALCYGAVGPWAPSFSFPGLALPGRVALHYASGLLALRPFAVEYPELPLFAARVGDGALVAGLAASLGTLLLALLTLAALRVWQRRATRDVTPSGGGLAFAALWALATLDALALWGGLHEPGADRHAYLLLPAVAVTAALAFSGDHMLAWRGLHRRALLAAAALALVALAATTRAQLPRWSSDAALWQDAVASPSPSSRALANFARSAAASGDYAAASRHLRRAIAADPSDPLLYLGRAALRCAERRPARARDDLRSALRLGAAPELATSIASSCLPAVLR